MTAAFTVWVLVLMPLLAGYGIGRAAVDLLAYVRRRRARRARTHRPVIPQRGPALEDPIRHPAYARRGPTMTEETTR